MVTVDFGPEIELMLFLRMHAKKSPNHCENVYRWKSYSPVTENRGRRSEWQGQVLTGSICIVVSAYAHLK